MIRRFTYAAVLLMMSSTAFAQAKPVTRTDYMKNVDARFAATDANHDGNIDVREMTARQQVEIQMARTAVGQQLRTQFTRLDTNKDRQLSLAEFLAAAPPVRTLETPQQLVQKLDRNGDGKVSVEEFRVPDLAKFNRVDTNRDGVASPQEQQAGARK